MWIFHSTQLVFAREKRRVMRLTWGVLIYQTDTDQCRTVFRERILIVRSIAVHPTNRYRKYYFWYDCCMTLVRTGSQNFRHILTCPINLERKLSIVHVRRSLLSFLFVPVAFFFLLFLCFLFFAAISSVKLGTLFAIPLLLEMKSLWIRLIYDFFVFKRKYLDYFR